MNSPEVSKHELSRRIGTYLRDYPGPVRLTHDGQLDPREAVIIAARLGITPTRVLRFDPISGTIVIDIYGLR